MTNHSFASVDHVSPSIPKGEKMPSKTFLKKRGRPRKPNMVKKLVKVDATLYEQITKKADEEHTTIAAILARAMKRELDVT